MTLTCQKKKKRNQLLPVDSFYRCKRSERMNLPAKNTAWLVVKLGIKFAVVEEFSRLQEIRM